MFQVSTSDTEQSTSGVTFTLLTRTVVGFQVNRTCLSGPRVPVPSTYQLFLAFVP